MTKSVCAFQTRYIRYIVDSQAFNPLHNPLQTRYMRYNVDGQGVRYDFFGNREAIISSSLIAKHFELPEGPRKRGTPNDRFPSFIRPADLEISDTADLETCVTIVQKRGPAPLTLMSHRFGKNAWIGKSLPSPSVNRSPPSTTASSRQWTSSIAKQSDCNESSPQISGRRPSIPCKATGVRQTPSDAL